MRTFYLTLLSLFTATAISGQGILDEYIREGLQSNSGLKQSKLQFEASLEALNEARGGLLPSIDFSSRYTKAHGGRAVEFPLGDMLNPVYSSLNGLLGEEQFPQIENQSFNFNRTTDIDNKLSLTQPIFDKRLSYQKEIAEGQSQMYQVDVAIEKRRLISEIKKAYFNYQKTKQLVELFDSTKVLVKENLRVSEVLFNNHKVTEDVVLRAQSEIGKVDLQIAEANKMRNTARAYFNFLLNRPLEQEIVQEEVREIPTLPAVLPTAIQNREEFTKIDYGLNTNESEQKLYESRNLPNIYAVADYGFQGSEYEFSSESDYALASLVLSWNLFSGFQNKAKKQQALLKRELLNSQREQLSDNIQLEAIQSFYDLREKTQSFVTTGQIADEAGKVYSLVNKKYREGIASQLDLIDARTNFTNSKIQNIISKYDTWISHAEYERITASYLIENL